MIRVQDHRRPRNDHDAHPERVFRTHAMSWHPSEWGEDSPWMKLFYNAHD